MADKKFGGSGGNRYGGDAELKKAISDGMNRVMAKFGGEIEINGTVNIDDSQIKDAKKEVVDLQKEAKKGIDIPVRSNVQEIDKSIQKAMSSKKRQITITPDDVHFEDGMNKIIERLHTKLQTAADKTLGGGLLTDKQAEDYVKNYIQYSKYAEKFQFEIQSAFKDIFDYIDSENIVKNVDTGKYLKKQINNPNWSAYSEANEEVEKRYGIAEKKVRSKKRQELKEADVAADIASGKELEQLAKRNEETYNRLEKVKLEASQLLRDVGAKLGEGVDVNQDKEYYDNQLKGIEATKQKMQELKDEMSDLGVSQLDKTFGEKVQSNNQLLGNIDGMVSMLDSQVQSAYNEMISNMEKAQSDAQAKIQKRTDDFINRVMSHEDFEKYGQIDWLDEYKEKLKDDTTDIDALYSEFEKSLSERKEKLQNIEQKNQKRGELRSWLLDNEGFSGKNRKKDLDAFLGGYKEYFDEIENTDVEVQDIIDRIQKARSKPSVQQNDLTANVNEALKQTEKQAYTTYEAVEKILHINYGRGSMSIDISKFLPSTQDDFKQLLKQINNSTDEAQINDNMRLINAFIEERKKMLNRWIHKTDKDSGWDNIHNEFDGETLENYKDVTPKQAQTMLTKFQGYSKILFDSYVKNNRIDPELKDLQTELFDQVKSGAIDAMSAIDQLQNKMDELWQQRINKANNPGEQIADSIKEAEQEVQKSLDHNESPISSGMSDEGKLKQQVQTLLEFDKTLDHVMGEERNQTSGKAFFDYLIEKGTEAQKVLFNVNDGFDAFQATLRGLSVKGAVDYSSTLGLDTLDLKLKEMRDFISTTTLPEQEQAAGQAAEQMGQNIADGAELAKQKVYDLLNSIIDLKNQMGSPDPRGRGLARSFYDIDQVYGTGEISDVREEIERYKKYKKAYNKNEQITEQGTLGTEHFIPTEDDLQAMKLRIASMMKSLKDEGVGYTSYLSSSEQKEFVPMYRQVSEAVEQWRSELGVIEEKNDAIRTKIDGIKQELIDTLSVFGEIDVSKIDALLSFINNRNIEENGIEKYVNKALNIPQKSPNETPVSNPSSVTKENDSGSENRIQENNGEKISVENLISEYEQLSNTLKSIESKYKGGIELGEDRDQWNEANKRRKEVSDQLIDSGMYYDGNKWVEDIVNLEDKYKELINLIETGDTKAISNMFNIDESELTDLEKLRENLKLVIDTLNATDGMDAKKAKLSWWHGWLDKGRDLIDSRELIGAFRNIEIPDQIINQVAEAHKKATEAAKEHAEAEREVVESADDQKQPHSSTVDQHKEEKQAAEDAAKAEEELKQKKEEASKTSDRQNTNQEEKTADAAKETADATKQAAEGVKAEGDSAKTAADAKIDFTRANNEAASSAKETADATKQAAEGIKQEGDSAKKQAQDNLVGDADQSPNEGKIIKEQITPSKRSRTYQDERGRTYEQGVKWNRKEKTWEPFSAETTNYLSFERDAIRVTNELSDAMLALDEAQRASTPDQKLIGSIKEYIDLLEEEQRSINEQAKSYADEHREYSIDLFNERVTAETKKHQAKNDIKDAKDFASGEKLKQKAIEETEALLSRQEATLNRYKQQYVDGSAYDFSDEDKEKVKDAYNAVTKKIGELRTKGSTNKVERQELDNLLKQYRLSAQQAEKNQKVASNLRPDNLEAAKAKLNTDLQSTLRDMKESNADTEQLEKELNDLIDRFNKSKDKATSNTMTGFQNELRTIKQNLKNTQDEYNFNQNSVKEVESAIIAFENATDKVAELQAKLDASGGKGDPKLVQDLNDAKEAAISAGEALDKVTDKFNGNISNQMQNRWTRAEDSFNDPTQSAKYKSAFNKMQAQNTRQTLNQYANDRAEYQKIYQQALSGEWKRNDNGDIVGNTALTNEQFQKMSSLMTEIRSIEQGWNDDLAEGLNLSKKQVQAREELKNASTTNTEEMLKQNAINAEATKLYNDMANRVDKMKGQSEWRADGWDDEVKKIEDSLTALNPSDVINEDKLEEFKQNILEIRKTYQDVSKSIDFQDIGRDWQAKAGADLAKWMNQNKIAAKEFSEALKQLNNDISQVGSKGAAQDWTARFQKIQEDAAKRGLLGKSLGDRFKDQFKNTMTSLATYYLSFQDFIRYGREAIQTITELDTQLTEMRKVSNESLQTLQDYQLETFDIADRVGTTAAQISASTADWMRLGEQLPEAKKSAEYSTMLLNVSEFQDINTATESLVAMSQAYQELDKLDIIDKLNNIGNNFSISTSELAESLQRSAGTLKVAGNSIDESIALTVAGNQVLQNPQMVGQSLRTIALRLTGTSIEDMQEAGEEIDGLITTQSKLRSTIMDATKVSANNYQGFDILDDNGNYKTTYEMLKGIASVWKQIGEEDKKMGTNRQSFLLETIAGKTRAAAASSILDNFETLQEVYEASLNSEGSAQQELDKYLDSIQGKAAQFQNALQKLTASAIDSSWIKGFIDLGTQLLGVLDDLGGAFGHLNTLIGAAAGIFLQVNGKGKSRRENALYTEHNNNAIMLLVQVIL